MSETRLSGATGFRKIEPGKPVADPKIYGSAVLEVVIHGRTPEDQAVSECRQLISRRKQLWFEKARLQQIPRAREDLINDALSRFEEKRKEIVERLLKRHFENVQQKKEALFNETAIHNLFSGNTYWQLFFLVVREEDIRNSAAALSTGGISDKDRVERSTELAVEIDVLTREIEKKVKELDKRGIDGTIILDLCRSSGTEKNY